MTKKDTFILTSAFLSSNYTKKFYDESGGDHTERNEMIKFDDYSFFPDRLYSIKANTILKNNSEEMKK